MDGGGAPMGEVQVSNDAAMGEVSQVRKGKGGGG